MAPSQTTPFWLRQTAPLQPPECVTNCLAAGDVGNCTTLLNFQCICTSDVYVRSVAACMAAQCNSTEIAIGQQYAAAACAPYTGGAPLPTQSVDVLTPPVTSTREFTNIQAIMSSICGALLLIAIGIGIISCRNVVKKEQMSSQAGSWTHMGTHGGDTKVTHGDFTYSRNASNFGGTSRIGQTSTFMSFGGDDDFVSSVPTLPIGRGNRSFGASRGFSNRLTLDETQEEWEMDAKNSPGGSLQKQTSIPEEQEEMPITPTTFGSVRDNHSEVELGSTVNLTGGRGEGRAI